MNLVVIVVRARQTEDKHMYNKSQGAKHYGRMLRDASHTRPEELDTHTEM